MTTYIALFEYEAGKQGFSVVFPDFPGLITAGDTYQETLQMAHEALAGHIEVLQDYGEIPKPRTIELIQETWEEWDEWKNNYSFLVVPIIDTVTSNHSEFVSTLEHSFER
ncbi:MAG: type II toxin-antitoxin system HicB family antitoxin [Fibromonadaceae bacterium]|jgi:predicted RNase H-like HicB family nuclease|nr:type II toxin-antitoxin system HicB family antitoxin [Fibromonadaceae bacterium]